MRLPRILAFSAFALLAGHNANATTYFDVITGFTSSPPPDSSSVMGDSFTAATPDFTTITLILSSSNSASGGSAALYLVPDNGDGSGIGHAGTPNLAAMGASTLIASILDSSLTDTASLRTFSVATSAVAPNQEYWVVLALDAQSSVGWYFNSDNGGVGTTGQATYYNGATNMLGAGVGPYQMIVDTPEPGTLAILGASLAALGLVRRRKAAQ